MAFAFGITSDAPRHAVALALLASLMAIAARTHREPDVRIDSEGSFWAFGLNFAAHGSVLAVEDAVGCERDQCRALVRIERVVDGRVTEEARIEVDNVDWLSVRDDLVVARLNSSQVAFYARSRSTWRFDQQLTVDERCVATRAREPVLVDDDVLVAQGDDHSCIYEQVRNRWQLAAVLPRSFQLSMVRDRVVLFDYIRSDVDVYVRRSSRWELERRLAAPAGSRWWGVLTSRRWIVADGRDEANNHVLYVYDGDHDNRLAAILPTINRDRSHLRAVSDSMIVATDQLWRFDGTAWSLQDFPTHDGPVRIGDLIWVGAPGNDGQDSGRIYGYRATD